MEQTTDNSSCGCHTPTKAQIAEKGDTHSAPRCGINASEQSCIVKRTIARICGLVKEDERGSPDEQPRYTLNGYVEEFIDTPVGRVPKVKTRLSAWDLGRHAIARMGIARANHRVGPGLYLVGKPGPDDPVLVTANYRLSFDALRKELSGIDAWILVLDTRGVNVWCAAAKKTFSTDEVLLQVKETQLERAVSHRRLVLPQLSATGVNARLVKKGCGFEVIWGPVRAMDIPVFLRNGMTCSEEMRTVDFPLVERVVLVPVEVSILLKPALVMALFLILISGIGPGIFSFSAAWERGTRMVTALFMGILSGAILTPVLLPFIPGRMFSIKGAISGLAAATITVLFCIGEAWIWELIPLFLVSTVFSSYLAMNFTGATPLTSPSGVEKEMRLALPWQVGVLLLALTIWVGSAFQV